MPRPQKIEDFSGKPIAPKLIPYCEWPECEFPRKYSTLSSKDYKALTNIANEYNQTTSGFNIEPDELLNEFYKLSTFVAEMVSVENQRATDSGKRLILNQIIKSAKCLLKRTYIIDPEIQKNIEGICVPRISNQFSFFHQIKEQLITLKNITGTVEELDALIKIKKHCNLNIIDDINMAPTSEKLPACDLWKKDLHYNYPAFNLTNLKIRLKALIEKCKKAQENYKKPDGRPFKSFERNIILRLFSLYENLKGQEPTLYQIANGCYTGNAYQFLLLLAPIINTHMLYEQKGLQLKSPYFFKSATRVLDHYHHLKKIKEEYMSIVLYTLIILRISDKNFAIYFNQCFSNILMWRYSQKKLLPC